MPFQDDLVNDLAEEVLRDMAGNFFGTRKHLEDKIEFVYQCVAVLRKKETEVTTRAGFLNYLLLTPSFTAEFYRSIHLDSNAFPVEARITPRSLPEYVPSALTLKGVLELDRAVQVGLAYASRNPDTAVIVTADHECGGLAVAGSLDQPYPYEPGGGLLDTLLAGDDGPFPVADSDYGFVLGWATTGHTSSPVPITAIGPGTENLAGVIENTDLFHVMAHALSLSETPASKRRS